MSALGPWVVCAREGDVIIAVTEVSAGGSATLRRLELTQTAFQALVADAPETTRWVWNDTTQWYPELLVAGVRVARCHDLRLAHAILSQSALVADSTPLRAAAEWKKDPTHAPRETATALFDWNEPGAGSDQLPSSEHDVLAEYERQRDAMASARSAAALRLLVAAESAGALLAEEMHVAGLPWSRQTHEQLLEEVLGSRSGIGGVPSRIAERAAQVREALGDPHAHLDSQPKLLRSLHRVGVLARSTSRWELAEFDHPVIAPLLDYKKLTRLLSANGWAWLDEWAPNGRFRPVYVPGGVVTGRWASSGGGALQLPRQLRPAVCADPGWTLVVADVAQLEPRTLAAMSADRALAAAALGQDLYSGLVAQGIFATRAEAKIAVLGAMYGATTGDSGRLVPLLRRAYPRAMGAVDAAARAGENGEQVSTWLGRTSPPASGRWQQTQGTAAGPDAGEAERSEARRDARDRGRFTRNFIVQGTAAEWALTWLAEIRTALAQVTPTSGPQAAASGILFRDRPHLAFFLHDEIIVHTPREDADAVAEVVRAAAQRATTLLFGDFPIDFPLEVTIADDAAKE